MNVNIDNFGHVERPGWWWNVLPISIRILSKINYAGDCRFDVDIDIGRLVLSLGIMGD